jgi:hypothetical protein
MQGRLLNKYLEKKETAFLLGYESLLKLKRPKLKRRKRIKRNGHPL